MSMHIAVVADDRDRSEAWLDAFTGDTTPVRAECITAHGSRAALRGLRPDVFVIDAAAAGAFVLCAELTAGDAAVVMVNVGEDERALDALTAGARGIVYASAPSGELVKAVHAVCRNQIWAPRHVIVEAWTRMRNDVARRAAGGAALAQRLSSREREVFRYAAAGMGNKELASRLAISEATVKVHLTHIFQKLGVRGRGELAAAYHGILP